MKGKAIYYPSGKAGEYAYLACNFFKGCSGGCSYCFLKKGITAKVLGGEFPVLKSCFRDQDHAFDIFCKEISKNLTELKKHGLFFSFTTDPCLPETWPFTWMAVEHCLLYGVPVKILTKQESALFYLAENLDRLAGVENQIAVGFTLTGHDELEPGCSKNSERIEAMRKLKALGFRTWASIEPIIDVDKSLEMIKQTASFCDLYKIGLESGKKYDKDKLNDFCFNAILSCDLQNNKIYFKDSIFKITGDDRSRFRNRKWYAERDFNIFTK